MTKKSPSRRTLPIAPGSAFWSLGSSRPKKNVRPARRLPDFPGGSDRTGSGGGRGSFAQADRPRNQLVLLWSTVSELCLAGGQPTRPGQRSGCRAPRPHRRPLANVPDAATANFRNGGATLVHLDRRDSRPGLRRGDACRLCCRGYVCAVADPLDVVAGDGRPCGWPRWLRPTRDSGCRLRQYRPHFHRSARRESAHYALYAQVCILGGSARERHVVSLRSL